MRLARPSHGSEIGGQTAFRDQQRVFGALGVADSLLGGRMPSAPKVMAEGLGHATVGITLDTYSHVAPALAKQAADDLAGLILGPSETH